MSASGAPKGALVELQVRPSLCILKAGEDNCRDQITISWQAEEPFTVCLYASGEAAPLRCWENSRSGRHASSLEARDDIRFQLIDAAQNPSRVLASGEFEVVAQTQRYRRRRRNPWSFF
ncbi:DUF3019 domain-containing protein [Gilvimarinus xylanilyticus]|uniref:DUF3019 domain-containing protein n=1 Tax=Gilvimarinus xylanilyticus TaxID=2944139 RepID=A0A9X2I1C9_9GAMM|nr:DUF3019 domain-containing protein [Gilvimarinus xylanilyticus]MCP8898868.1 DUF3019 domain-containing protein [Gilvimarinus xylanilyticus]